jgi:hypothetical protein
MAAVLFTPSTALASSGWSTPLSVIGNNLAPGSGLSSVSCPSTSFCLAVGTVNFYAYEPQKPYGVAVTFNGSSWSAPIKPPAGEGQMIAVSCSPDLHCLGLDNLAQALSYHGGAWSAPINLGNSTVGEPRSVSCVSASFCVALADLGPVVGDESQEPGGGALIYNGSTWSAPITIDNRVGALYSVSCASVSFCVAVGGGPEQPGDAVVFNGTSWGTPETIDGYNHQLNSVSCASSSFCVAVDERGDALTYNGTTWSAPVHIAPAAGGRELEAVSCPTSSFCAAVGQTNANPEQGDALIFNGSGWSAPPFADDGTGLRSVSCASPSFCRATDDEGGVLSYPVEVPLPSNSEHQATLRVRPTAARVGRRVRVSGSIRSLDGQFYCEVGDQVKLYSRAFGPRHKFEGIPTVYGKVGGRGSFSAHARIPTHRRTGIYTVNGFCEGSNIEAVARLRVFRPK